jgi:basic amino acid/polyamine antiporter, APA family
MSVAYLATSASIFWFRRQGISRPGSDKKLSLVIPALGVIFSAFLITQCTLPQMAIGAVLFLIGVPIYVWYSPKKELASIKSVFLSPQTTLKRIAEQE